MYLANEKEEPKDKAVTSISYPFQGRMFHPCQGFMYWIRWGEYVFDIRTVRIYGGKKPERRIDVEHSQASFCKKITEVVEIVGNEDFHQFMKKAEKHLLKKAPKQIKKNGNDELPF